ncbi:hypothetical protein PF005_g9140 [Phytophthora fragariae]|uniref:Uncharacterized protein n=1 Tax=Phytophthora fragariae TaxID=53985 RepID=A0A6A3ZKA4_9STRA|nr:hypothetical protein PF003_g31065 [Phytophthora fragariae]KAE8943914.1 hypothetical protein PF009_g6378 [Phytophthora fragariae]KAE9021995.1 hypothetical protein PF011_g4676 [Phytophthora fragariae]KAE9113499.1 hypothetical protein PF007_g10716 [Phytophthora fragariae]KAE9116711.1 hypothetical protein PF010_g8861 [Phytophthora fragariae]
MEAPSQDRSNTTSDKSSVSSLHRRFHANLQRVQEQEAGIQQLQQQTQDQQQRIDELEEQARHPTPEADKEHERQLAQLRSELADRDRLLQEQDVEMDQATETMSMLIQHVQALKEVVARAEQAQRDAEADQMLRHVLREGDDDGVDSEVIEQLRVELQSSIQAQQQSSRLVCELEEERVWLKETAEMLSRELQELKEAKCDLILRMQSEQEAKSKTDEELERLKAVASLRDEFVAVLQAQVKAMHTDKQKLEHAIACCQRSADQRFQVLEKDRQSIEAENDRLRAELSSLRRNFAAMSSKLLEIENDVELEYDDEYDARLGSEAGSVVGVKQAMTASSSVTTLALIQEDSQELVTGNNLQQGHIKNVPAYVLVKKLELLLSAQLDHLVARRDNISARVGKHGNASSDYDDGADAADADWSGGSRK